MPGLLVDDGAVEVARQQQLGEGDREEAPELLRVATFGRGAEQAGQPRDSLQGRPLGRGEGGRDGVGRDEHPLLELGEILLGRGSSGGGGSPRPLS